MREHVHLGDNAVPIRFGDPARALGLEVGAAIPREALVAGRGETSTQLTLRTVGERVLRRQVRKLRECLRGHASSRGQNATGRPQSRDGGTKHAR